MSTPVHLNELCETMNYSHHYQTSTRFLVSPSLTHSHIRLMSNYTVFFAVYLFGMVMRMMGPSRMYHYYKHSHTCLTAFEKNGFWVFGGYKNNNIIWRIKNQVRQRLCNDNVTQVAEPLVSSVKFQMVMLKYGCCCECPSCHFGHIL